MQHAFIVDSFSAVTERVHANEDFTQHAKSQLERYEELLERLKKRSAIR